MSLQAFKDNLARGLYGMTATEAVARGICINCKQIPTPFPTEAARREYLFISGLCDACFKKACGSDGN